MVKSTSEDPTEKITKVTPLGAGSCSNQCSRLESAPTEARGQRGDEGCEWILTEHAPLAGRHRTGIQRLKWTHLSLLDSACTFSFRLVAGAKKCARAMLITATPPGSVHAGVEQLWKDRFT